MRCFECGHLNPSGAQFCNYCGRRMTKQLIILDSQSPNEVIHGAGDGFHPARFAQDDTNNSEHESARTVKKADRFMPDQSEIAAAQSAFHPARFSVPGLRPNSPLPNTASSRDTESAATGGARLLGESTKVPSSVCSVTNEDEYNMHSPWFHAASIHYAEKSSNSTFRATEQEKPDVVNEDEIANRAWRIPRIFNNRGTSRLYSDTPMEEIMIEPPPKVDGLFRANWKSVFFAPTITLVLIVTLLAMILLMRGSNLPFYSALIAVMFVAGLSGGIAEYLLQAAQWRAKQELKKFKYIEYLEKLESAWNKRTERQLQMLTLRNPSIEGCIALMESRSERIWERTEKDDDFLCARVGRGKRAFELGILMPPVSYEEKEAELHTRMRDLVEAHRYISPAPVLLDLKMQTMVGILGNSSETSLVIQNIIIQLATFHSPEEVEFVLMGTGMKDTARAKIFQLPHVHRICDTDEAQFSTVRSVLEQRSLMLGQPDHDAKAVKKRFLVLFILEVAELTELDFEMLPLLLNPEYNTCVILQSAAPNRFPVQTEMILKVSGTDGEICRNQSDEAPQYICLDLISAEQMSRFLSSLRGYQS